MTAQSAALIFFSTIGLAFSHCLGMCGGIVLAYSRGKMQQIQLLMQLLMHGLYSIGRITSYVLIGLLVRVFGASLDFKGGLFFVILGSSLVLLAFLYTFSPKLISKLEPSIGNAHWYKATFAYFLRSQSQSSFYFLGVLNGFLPCGMVYFFALNTLAFDNIKDSMLAMVIFGLGTSAPLLLFGIFFSAGFRAKFARIFQIMGFLGMSLLGGHHIFEGIRILNGGQTHAHSPQIFKNDDMHHHHGVNSIANGHETHTTDHHDISNTHSHHENHHGH